jgi:hypothetical protein
MSRAGSRPHTTGLEAERPPRSEHPGSCLAARAIATEDVRYVVLYRGDSADFDLASFRADWAAYRKVFANPSVIIYAPRSRPARASGARSGGQDSMASAGCMAY